MRCVRHVDISFVHCTFLYFKPVFYYSCHFLTHHMPLDDVLMAGSVLHYFFKPLFLLHLICSRHLQAGKGEMKVVVLLLEY